MPHEAALALAKKRVEIASRCVSAIETWTAAMTSTFETVARIIASTSDVPLESITPDSHVMKDLEVDSLGFLDVVFEIDKTFDIRLPVEEWLQNVQGGYDGDTYFVLRNLCDYIDQTAGSAAVA